MTEHDMGKLLEQLNENMQICVGVSEQVSGHHTTLYGPDGRSGVVADMIHVDHSIAELTSGR